MGKKTLKKIAAKDADQYMLRLPPGLRDRVAKRAAENGRSMNTEIIEAIEKHLSGEDRMTRVWEFFEKNRKNVEGIDHIWDALMNLEWHVERLVGAPLSALREARRAAEKGESQ